MLPALLCVLSAATAQVTADLPPLATPLWPQPEPELQLGVLLQGFSVKFDDCKDSTECCQNRWCFCNSFHKCDCQPEAYMRNRTCMKKKDLSGACNTSAECLIEHSRCLDNRCRCPMGYYPYGSGDEAVCSSTQSTFFTTTIVISVCVLFAAVAIGVIMQIRTSLQRRLYREQYRRHCRREIRLARAMARRGRDDANTDTGTRRYSEQEEPDEPPPPYVPIFHTRSSGDWGKLPSYQEATQAGAKNEAFELQEEGAASPVREARASPVREARASPAREARASQGTQSESAA